MDKGQLHHWWQKIKPISPWYLLILAIISGVICVNALRQNNLKMIELRNQVFTVDKKNGDIEGALKDLREFIYAHMNTNLNSGNNNVKPPIQLKYRYERLFKAENGKVREEVNKTYANAQTYCVAKFPSYNSGRSRINCINDYVNSHGPSETVIDESLYKFDFVSPSWTPDLAGWSLVISAILGLLFILRLGLQSWVKKELRNHL